MKSQFELPGFSVNRVIAAIAMMLVFLFADCQTGKAQIFKREGGLFNRKTEAPRAKTYDEIGVPVPVTGRVTTIRGQEITFEIKAETKVPGMSVDFLIRTFPSAGRITSMVSKPKERNKAIITYYADPDSTASADAFAFAVRYRDGRYSSAMRYDIEIEGDGMPGSGTGAQIQVAKSEDFGEVMVGDEAIRKILVRNIGSGPFENQIFLSPPWYLVEPKNGMLSVGPQGTREVSVAFRPDLTGETSYFLSFSRSSAGTTKLAGVGIEPFTLLTEAVELKLDKSTRERVGEIKLQNAGKKPLRVNVQGSTRVQNSLAEAYLLSPDKPTSVEVKLGPTDTAPFDGSVQFSMTNGFSKFVKVIAPVVPGELEVTVPSAVNNEIINFGKVEAGRSVEQNILIKNIGGVAVPLEFHVPSPFRVLNDPGVQLAPLASVSLSIGLYPAVTQKGLVDTNMSVISSDQVVNVRLMGNVLKSSAAPVASNNLAPNLPSNRMRIGNIGGSGNSSTPASEAPSPFPANQSLSSGNGNKIGGSTPAPVPSGSVGRGSEKPWYTKLKPDELEDLKSPLGFPTLEIVARDYNPELKSPEDLSVVARESDSLTIGWTAPKNSELSNFDVEIRGAFVNEQTKMMESAWFPYAAVELERIDRLVKAKIKKLSPYTTYEFRVITVDENGRSSRPSEAMHAQTDLPMDWTYIYLVSAIVLLTILILAIIKIIRDRRPDVYQSKYAES